AGVSAAPAGVAAAGLAVAAPAGAGVGGAAVALAVAGEAPAGLVAVGALGLPPAGGGGVAMIMIGAGVGCCSGLAENAASMGSPIRPANLVRRDIALSSLIRF